MNKRKLFYFECNLAGRQYHEANDVWNKLKVGTKLCLVREKNNRYDPDAIAVGYLDVETGYIYTLGYIPAKCNGALVSFMDMGWRDIFECQISKISPDEHYENQIRITISIMNKTLL